jgi:LuxR family maltose regulon positive regulatory protein
MFPFSMAEAADLMEAVPRHETAHSALLAEIVDLVDGASAPGSDRDSPSLLDELSPSERRVLRYLPTNMTQRLLSTGRGRASPD